MAPVRGTAPVQAGRGVCPSKAEQWGAAGTGALPGAPQQRRFVPITTEDRKGDQVLAG